MSKRELIDTGTDKRYVRRAKEGKFNETGDEHPAPVAEISIEGVVACPTKQTSMPVISPIVSQQ